METPKPLIERYALAIETLKAIVNHEEIFSDPDFKKENPEISKKDYLSVLSFWAVQCLDEIGEIPEEIKREAMEELLKGK